jgi:hypothetical protein
MWPFHISEKDKKQNYNNTKMNPTAQTIAKLMLSNNEPLAFNL